MDPILKEEAPPVAPSTAVGLPSVENKTQVRTKNKSKDKDNNTSAKRRCVSTACIACRKRKSRCNGEKPRCGACASVYLTECEYAPHTDHRRKGVYTKDTDNLKTKSSTLQTLIHAMLNMEEEDAFDLVRKIRSCDNLEELAQAVENRDKGLDVDSPDSPIYRDIDAQVPRFEAELSGRMGDLVLDGSVKFIGGTSNLIWLNDPEVASAASPSATAQDVVRPREEAILSWTTVTDNKDLILHFMNMYFCWHYAYFTTLSKELFYRDFLSGVNSQYCSPLLVNVMLALGCHFSSRSAARKDPDDSGTTGDHYFAEAKKLLHLNDEFAFPKLCTVQALALMSVREAGCGRESKGWVYSGMSFRMASDLGLNVDVEPTNSVTRLSDEDIDARRITFWGCFFFDKCWSNYLGRQPQLLLANFNVKKPEVFPNEDAEMWSPYTDVGVVHAHSQPARTRAIALENYKLGEISSDLLSAFYQPQTSDKSHSKQAELKKLSDIHTRLEAWKRDLPAELDPRDGQLPQILLMHMFYQLLYIHLYRPFLRYTKATSPLPAHVSPRKFCTQAAGAISKLFRLYKRTHGLRQVCNIAVYIAHSACTIHLLNLPDKNARRDIIHGVKQLEEIGECWTCARRTLRILALCAEKWKIELPEEAYTSFARAKQRWTSIDPGSPAVLPNIASNNEPHEPRPTQEYETTNQDLQGQYRMQLQQQQQANTINYDTSSSVSPQPQISLPRSMTQPPAVNIEKQISSQMTMPAQPILEPPRNSNRLRSFAQLTKAQQDAWNAHQAKLAGQTSSVPRTIPTEPPNNAAVLFGGVDTLIEESQDWWYNDQSQLALGFDNWNPPSTTDWPGMSNSLNLGISEEPITTPMSNSGRFYNGEILPNDFTPASSSVASVASTNGYSTSQHHQQQRLQRQLQQQRPLANMNSLNRGVQPGLDLPVGQKRLSTFDNDDDMFY